MNKFSIREVAQRDILTALGLWLTLEVICFAILPALKFIEPGDRLRAWFMTSVPLGILGSFTVGVSSHLLIRFNQLRYPESKHHPRKTFLLALGQLIGLLGLGGVGFPAAMVIAEFFLQAFQAIQKMLLQT